MIAPFITLFINLAWGISLEKQWVQELAQPLRWAQGARSDWPSCTGGATAPLHPATPTPGGCHLGVELTTPLSPPRGLLSM